jgi:plastocyanin
MARGRVRSSAAGAGGRPVRAARRAPLAALGALAIGAVLGPWRAAHGAPTVEVTVRGNRFDPAELTVPAGTTVRWVNREARTSHSVIWQGGAESERFFPGEHYERRFERPGRYPYGCGPHPEMKGVVVVTD